MGQVVDRKRSAETVSAHPPLLEEHKKILLGSQWLATRSPEFQEAFLSLGHLVEYPEEHVLYREGRSMFEVSGLIRGQVDVVMKAPNGLELVSPSTTPNRWFGFGELITDLPAIATAIVRMPTLMHRVSRAEFLQFLEANPSRYKDVMAYEVRGRQINQEGFLRALTTSGEARVASTIDGLFDANWLSLDKPISIPQERLATFAGVSMPTLQRAFRHMKKEGALATRYGKLIVKDIEKVRQIANATED